MQLDKLKHYDKIYQLDQNINTPDAIGRLLFNMLGALAQFETEIRAKRQMKGIQTASSYRGPQPWYALPHPRDATAILLKRRGGQEHTASVFTALPILLPPPDPGAPVFQE
jgi:Resolvase, N terminal domain